MNHKHAKTLAKIYHHPISNDIQWTDLMKLFKGLEAQIDINKHSGKTTVLLSEQQIILPKQTHKFISSHKEVVELRHFFESINITPS
jgi:hypothetical protein